MAILNGSELSGLDNIVANTIDGLIWSNANNSGSVYIGRTTPRFPSLGVGQMGCYKVTGVGATYGIGRVANDGGTYMVFVVSNTQSVISHKNTIYRNNVVYVGKISNGGTIGNIYNNATEHWYILFRVS